MNVTSPIRWVPSAYLAEGIPYAIVAWTTATLLKDLGYPDSDITGPLALLLAVWSLKPLYAGMLETYWLKRNWVVLTQTLMAAMLLACAAVLSLDRPYWLLVGLLSVFALAGSAHDICVDGIYVTTLDVSARAHWIGFQGAFWNLGRVFSASVLVAVATTARSVGVEPRPAWQASFVVGATILFTLGMYHRISLPHEAEQPPLGDRGPGALWSSWVEQWRSFTSRPGLLDMLAFVFFFRFAEGFLLLETPLFMQSSLADGGLGMCATATLTPNCPHWLSHRAFIEGFLSTAVSVVFGILGGKFAARRGLDTRLLLVMALCINVPNLTLLYLSHLGSTGEVVPLGTIAALVCLEKAGYSFGFVANMLYMMQEIAPGRFPTTHLAWCTALMNAAIVPTQALSGRLAETLGYRSYFALVCLAALPSFWVAWKAPFARR